MTVPLEWRGMGDDRGWLEGGRGGGVTKIPRHRASRFSWLLTTDTNHPHAEMVGYGRITVVSLSYHHRASTVKHSP